MSGGSDRPRLPRFAPLAALIVAYPLLHGAVSDLCDAGARRLGFEAFNAGALRGLAVACALGATAGLWRLRADRAALLWAGALGLASVSAWRWLMVANVELVHLPQFALLAGLGLRAGLGPAAAWALATGAGVTDELYQEHVLYAGRADTYLDYNDMALDALGAAWGVLLSGGRSGWAGRALQGALLLAAAAALTLDPPALEPLLREGVTGRPYRRLGAGEALLAGALVWRIARR